MGEPQGGPAEILVYHHQAGSLIRARSEGDAPVAAGIVERGQAEIIVGGGEGFRLRERWPRGIVYDIQTGGGGVGGCAGLQKWTEIAGHVAGAPWKIAER